MVLGVRRLTGDVQTSEQRRMKKIDRAGTETRLAAGVAVGSSSPKLRSTAVTETERRRKGGGKGETEG